MTRVERPRIRSRQHFKRKRRVRQDQHPGERIRRLKSRPLTKTVDYAEKPSKGLDAHPVNPPAVGQIAQDPGPSAATLSLATEPVM